MRPVFDPWVGKIPWRRAWQPTPVFLPGESPRTETGGLQSTGLQRVRHDWVTKHKHDMLFQMTVPLHMLYSLAGTFSPGWSFSPASTGRFRAAITHCCRHLWLAWMLPEQLYVYARHLPLLVTYLPKMPAPWGHSYLPFQCCPMEIPWEPHTQFKIF